MTLSLLWKYKNWIAIAVFFVLWLGQIAYTNHLSGKLNAADAKCVQQIQRVNDAYQNALTAWKTKAFNAEDKYLQETQKIKIEFRDIKHETQKIITERVYTDCKLTDDGMLNAERARIAANTTKPPDSM